MLQARFPKHELVVRNLGFSGDEIATRLRSKNFGTPDEWLSGLAQPIGGYEDNRLRRDQHEGGRRLRLLRLQRVVRRTGRLDEFKKELDRLDRAHARAEVQRQVAPRVVLFSPIAHEDLGNPDLPDGKDNNQRLALYTKAMAEVGASRKHHASSISSRRAEALRRKQGAAHDPGHPPQPRRESSDRPGDRSNALWRRAASTRRPC